MSLYKHMQAESVLKQNQGSPKFCNNPGSTRQLKKLITTPALDPPQAFSMGNCSSKWLNPESEPRLSGLQQNGEPNHEVKSRPRGVNWLHLTAAGALILTVLQGAVSQSTHAPRTRKTIKITLAVAALLAGKATADVIDLAN
jgi:hypothetical protein